MARRLPGSATSLLIQALGVAHIRRRDDLVNLLQALVELKIASRV